MKCESRVKLADIVIEIKQRVELASISIRINSVNVIAEEGNNEVLCLNGMLALTHPLKGGSRRAM